MRVGSFLGLLVVFICFAFAEEEKVIFDQGKWNQAVGNILSAIVSNGFPDHFRPDHVNEKATKEYRVRMQTERLRALVGTTLSESLRPYEVFCPFDHISSEEAFVQVAQELQKLGWNATWVPDEKIKRCKTKEKGFLLVKLKKE